MGLLIILVCILLILHTGVVSYITAPTCVLLAAVSSSVMAAVLLPLAATDDLLVLSLICAVCWRAQVLPNSTWLQPIRSKCSMPCLIGQGCSVDSTSRTDRHAVHTTVLVRSTRLQARKGDPSLFFFILCFFSSVIWFSGFFPMGFFSPWLSLAPRFCRLCLSLLLDPPRLASRSALRTALLGFAPAPAPSASGQEVVVGSWNFARYLIFLFAGSLWVQLATFLGRFSGGVSAGRSSGWDGIVVSACAVFHSPLSLVGFSSFFVLLTLWRQIMPLLACKSTQGAP